MENGIQTKRIGCDTFAEMRNEVPVSQQARSVELAMACVVAASRSRQCPSVMFWQGLKFIVVPARVLEAAYR